MVVLKKVFSILALAGLLLVNPAGAVDIPSPEERVTKAANRISFLTKIPRPVLKIFPHDAYGLAHVQFRFELVDNKKVYHVHHLAIGKHFLDAIDDLTLLTIFAHEYGHIRCFLELGDGSEECADYIGAHTIGQHFGRIDLGHRLVKRAQFVTNEFVEERLAQVIVIPPEEQ